MGLANAQTRILCLPKIGFDVASKRTSRKVRVGSCASCSSAQTSRSTRWPHSLAQIRLRSAAPAAPPNCCHRQWPDLARFDELDGRRHGFETSLHLPTEQIGKCLRDLRYIFDHLIPMVDVLFPEIGAHMPLSILE
jgi:hypothetical protein